MHLRGACRHASCWWVRLSIKFVQERRVFSSRDSDSGRKLGQYVKPDVWERRPWVETTGRCNVRERRQQKQLAERAVGCVLEGGPGQCPSSRISSK